MAACTRGSYRPHFAAVILLGVSLFLAWQAQRIEGRRTWDSTYGQVIGQRKAQFEIPPRLQRRFGPPMTKPRVHTSVWTDYSYEVDGERFVGNWLESSSSSRGKVVDWPDWPESSRSFRGEFVLVYYDPDHPDQSVLKLPAAAVPRVAFAVSILLFILGIFVEIHWAGSKDGAGAA